MFHLYPDHSHEEYRRYSRSDLRLNAIEGERDESENRTLMINNQWLNLLA